MIMKRLIPFAGLVFLAGCEIYLFDEQYVAWDDRDFFIGSYHVEEYSQTTEQFYCYDIHIQKSCCKAHEIRINNFYGADLDVYAIVNDDRITIPLQKAEGYEIEGTGKVTSNRLVITFVARDLYVRPVFADFVDIEGWMY